MNVWKLARTEVSSLMDGWAYPEQFRSQYSSFGKVLDSKNSSQEVETIPVSGYTMNREIMGRKR